MGIPSGMLKTITEEFEYWHFIVFLAILLLIYSGIIIWRLRNGNEIEIKFLWGIIGPIRFFPSRKMKVLEEAYLDLKGEYKEVLSFARRKSNMIKLLGEVNREIERLNQPDLSKDEFDRLFEKVLDFILPGVITIFTGDTGNMLRIALLTLNDENEFAVYKGCGYNIEEQERFRSSVCSSIARTVLLSGNSQYIPDITQDPNWNFAAAGEDTIYHTVFCTVIGHHSKWGVLMINAKDVDSFSIDDRDCIKYIAQALAVIFEIQRD